MTMHLARGLTTLNTKQKKSKRKPDSFYMKGWKEQNKFWKKHKLPIMELSEYIDYVHGKWKPKDKVQPQPMLTSTDTPVRVPVRNPEPEKKLDPPKLGNGIKINWKEQQERLEISRQYSIAPAYNKGPYMVVAREDLKTAGKKV